jgi:hypothetical protein
MRIDIFSRKKFSDYHFDQLELTKISVTLKMSSSKIK